MPTVGVEEEEMQEPAARRAEEDGTHASSVPFVGLDDRSAGGQGLGCVELGGILQGVRGMRQDASDEIRSSIKAGSGGERHVGAVRISLSRQGLGRRAASLLLWCGVFLLLGLGVGGADDNVLNAKIVWREQKLLNCEKYFENSLKCKCFTFNPILNSPCKADPPTSPDFEKAAQRMYSCTAVPQKLYAESTCDGRCTPLVTDYTTFNASCMTMVGSLEDTWTSLATTFVHDPGLGIPAQTPAENPFTGSTIRVTVNVSYGFLDIFETSLKCPLVSSPDGLISQCVVAQSMFGNSTDGRNVFPQYVSYTLYKELIISQIIMVGSFEEVYTALDSLKFRPEPNVNTVRLKSRIFSSQSARDQPFEIMRMSIEFLTSGNGLAAGAAYRPIGFIEQMIYTVNNNDRPTILAPADSYQLPNYCVSGRNPKPECHFGQIFSYEDRDTNVEVLGVQIDDVDVYETCVFANPACAKIDVTVAAKMGAIALNTRTGLASYESTRSSQGFTSLLSSANSAVRVLNYRVEETQLLGPSSKTFDYNTQYGSLTEFITVTVSDQGYSGAVGVSEVNTVTIPVTIVAVNDAPVIQVSEIEYDFTEDIPSPIVGIAVTDKDVDQKIVSTLSQLTWTNGAGNMSNLNTMMLTASVNFGKLRMRYFRNLRIVRTNENYMVSFKNFRFGHDLCRIKAVLDGTSPKAVSEAIATLGVDAVRYKDVCMLNNLGSPVCATGTETACTCLLEGDCNSPDPTYVMYLNASKEYEPFVRVIEEAILMTDKTCGGTPIYPAPNNFTTGLSCETDDDCAAARLPACTPGVNCMCCANLTHGCSSDADCNAFDAKSSCGCIPSGPAAVGAAAIGACGPYCRDSRLSKGCVTDLVIAPVLQFKYYGAKCTFAAPFPDGGPGFTRPTIRTCRSASFMSQGSSSQLSQDLVSSQHSNGGSRLLSFIGGIVDVNRAAQGLSYITNPYYNRQYRPPVEERDLNFQIDSDSLDRLMLFLSDMGNSGGGDYSPQVAFQTTPIRVRAINNQPVIHGPDAIEVEEDKPFYLTSKKMAYPWETPNGLRVSDPDYHDYLFDEAIFSVNISATQGRLFLNEEYLMGEGAKLISYKFWPGEARQKRVGLHHPGRPKFGYGCQTNLQCTDTIKNDDFGRPFIVKSIDTPYGFFTTVLYGVVYGVDKDGRIQGCGLCGEDVGNKFLSIEGTFIAVNKAIERVTYLPDPHYNTRIGGPDAIVLEVSDNGATGNGGAPEPLANRMQIPVKVTSVNDRPIIGRRVRMQRTMSSFAVGVQDLVANDYAVLAVNKTLDELCMGIPPHGDEYTVRCGPGKREYIDIDEDTIFTVSPDVMWIHDVDSDEAERTTKRYCCPEAGPNGCQCGQPCMCGVEPCTRCPEPATVCGGGAGFMNMIISVERGTLSFYPPPGRNLFTQQQMMFLTNTSGGDEVPCGNQLACMRGVKRLSIRATKSSIQQGLEQLFLTYLGDANYYGRDKIDVFVNDNANTDFCYNQSLFATETINVRIMGINDPPTAIFPSSKVMSFQGLPCYSNFMKFSTNIEGLAPECLNVNGANNIPPASSRQSPVLFADPDLGDTPFGNMTVVLTVGNNVRLHGKAGQFFLPRLRYPEFDSKAWYEAFTNSDGLTSMALSGTLEDLNWLMTVIRFDTYPGFKGYLVFKVQVNDLGNFGECGGGHNCGSGKVCADHKTAEPHGPTLPQLYNFVLDADVGTVARCEATDCKTCNGLEGCGWCPGACTQDGGKCMIGRGRPTYEACPVDILGRTYEQCVRPTNDYFAIGLGVAAGVVGVALVVFFTLRWAQRRHGSIIAYARKKRSDLNRAGQRLHIIPPESAKYDQFFFLLALSLAIFIISQSYGREEPLCMWRQSHFLDRAVSIYLTVDGCSIRFVPASSKQAPDRDITAIKMNFAYQHDPAISLDAQTCGENGTFMLSNTLSDELKYRSYYCNIEVIVPDRVVVPKFTVNAVGDNTTFVRGGPMEKDTPYFGMDFGPNELAIKGVRVVAHLQNITAKKIVYDVRHGYLNAFDITTSVGGTFSSEDADMLVTTSTRTTAKFWQKSGNKVCFTAANGSMYVDDSCRLICKYPSVSGKSASRRGGGPDQTEEASLLRYEREASLSQLPRGPNGGLVFASPPPGFSTESSFTSSLGMVGSALSAFGEVAGGTPARRQVVVNVPAFTRKSWECFGDPKKDDSWNCSVFDPVAAFEKDVCPAGTKYSFRSQVPVVEGCTDLKFCLYDESSQCLCKPNCDMKNLDPPGKCNDLGQCCQTICQGYSTADLFPDDNQPRCGSRIDPIGMPWCDGALDQTFTFTSESGQIDLQVLRSPMKQSKVYSYQGSSPFTVDARGYRLLSNGTAVAPVFDLNVSDKKSLDRVFHAADRNSPTTDWFVFKISGPGTVPLELGAFAWLSNVMYLVIESWILETLSLGMLNPTKDSVALRLNPGFCPHFVDFSSDAFAQRLIAVRRLIKDTLEKYPSGSDRPIPTRSVLAFLPGDGLLAAGDRDPRVFVTDAQGEVAVNKVLAKDYPMLGIVMYLSCVIPLAVTFGTLSLAFYRARKYILEYREKRMLLEHVSFVVNKAFTLSKEEAADDSWVYDKQALKEMRDRTSFYFMFDDWLGLAHVERSFWVSSYATTVQLSFVLLPAMFAYVASILVYNIYIASQCNGRNDYCSCLSQAHPLDFAPQAIRYVTYAYSFIVILELGIHLLEISHNLFRRVLRALFYAAIFIMWWVAYFCIVVVIFIIYIGVLVRPIWLIPYTVALGGTLASVVAYYNALLRFEVRLRKGVEARMRKYKTQLGRSMPTHVVNVLCMRSVDSALSENGFSLPRIVSKCFQFFCLITLVYVFLFIGFLAFTDKNDQIAGFVNTFLAYGVAYAAFQFAKGSTEEGETRDQVGVVEMRIMASLTHMFDVVTDQVELASRMFRKMRRGFDDGSYGESLAESSGVYGTVKSSLLN